MDNCMPSRETAVQSLKSFIKRRQRELDNMRSLLIALEGIKLSPEADEALWSMVISKLG